jgi:hypothetical protein
LKASPVPNSLEIAIKNIASAAGSRTDSVAPLT